MRASKSTSRETERRPDLCRPISGKLLLGLLVCVLAAPAASQNVRVVHEFQPGVKWGGRAVAIASTGPSNNVIIATESGGLFSSVDGGDTWFHLDGLPPFRMFDVKYKPLDPSVVIATAMRDSRAINGGGIWRSLDGGDHWQRQPTVDPPPGTLCPARASAYGIAFQPGTNNVYVGTDCGLAITRSLGLAWTHVVPDRTSPRVWSVAASSDGTVYICGDAGARLSQTQGSTWSPPFQGIGACAPAVHGIDFSPEAKTVFIITASNQLFRCDADGSGCTDMQAPSVDAAQRVPMVRVSPAISPSNSIDVYFSGKSDVYRQTCLIEHSTLRCPANWTGPVITGDAHHSDVNDVAFSGGRCQLFAATDGGVARSTDCGNAWSNVGTSLAGFHALQIYDVAGQLHPDHTDLYFGTQDNGLWSAGDDGTWPPPPSPPLDEEGGGFELERRCPDHGCRLIAWAKAWPGNLVSTNSHFATNLPWNGPPGNSIDACHTPTIISRGVYVQFSQSLSGSGSTLYLTGDDGRNWNPVMTVGQTLAGCPQASGPPDNPTLYQAIQLPGSTRLGDPNASLLRITRILSGGGTASASQAGVTLHSLGQYCMGEGVLGGGIGCVFVFGASRTDPLRLIAPDIDTGEMKKSTDGGATWTADPGLTALATGQGTFQFNFGNGDNGTRMQVHAIAFDPDNRSHIVVGTEAAGLIESFDGGASWNTVGLSNQVTAVSGFFFKDDNSIIVATYGRGLWRIHDCGQPCHATAFSMSVMPTSVSIPANDSVSVHLSTALVAGDATPINLSFYVPRGVVAGQFIPTSVTPGQGVDLGFAVPLGTPPGPKGAITILGSDGIEARSVTVDVTTTQCVPITCQADMCGRVDDKCGNPLDCGICPPDPCRHCQTPRQCCICNGGVWVGGRCQ